jgi:hypothetical protein
MAAMNMRASTLKHQGILRRSRCVLAVLPKNTEALFAQLHASRILVVSHFYHLPRVKLAYQRDGWNVYTVPANESYLLGKLPYNMAREVAALWVYFFRPLGAQGARDS